MNLRSYIILTILKSQALFKKFKHCLQVSILSSKCLLRISWAFSENQALSNPFSIYPILNSSSTPNLHIFIAPSTFICPRLNNPKQGFEHKFGNIFISSVNCTGLPSTLPCVIIELGIIELIHNPRYLICKYILLLIIIIYGGSRNLRLGTYIVSISD